MRLLLDTHIFLWLISGDKQLQKAVLDAISDPENDVFLSVVSLWEIIIKHSIGRLPLPKAPEIYIPEQRVLHQIESLVISERSLKKLGDLPPHHRDPFDRLLISQALSENLTIITVDPEIRRYPVECL